MQREKKTKRTADLQIFFFFFTPLHSRCMHFSRNCCMNERRMKNLRAAEISLLFLDRHISLRLGILQENLWSKKNQSDESLSVFFFFFPPQRRERRRQSEIFFSCLTRAKLFIFKPLVSFALARCVFEEPEIEIKYKVEV